MAVAKTHLEKVSNALEEVLSHYKDAISSWPDPLRMEAVAKQDILDKARKELSELRAASHADC